MKIYNTDWNTDPHSTVIFKEYFENTPSKSFNIAKIFIKLLERFLKYCRNLAMSVQNIINRILLSCEICHHSYDVFFKLIITQMKFRLIAVIKI